MEESDSSTADYVQGNSGLLRFRSAPSSLLENFAKKERLSSRFCPAEESGMSSPQGVCGNATMSSELPPQYPRQGGGQFGYLGLDSLGVLDHHNSQVQQQQGKVGSGLMRQNSSPAGLFSHIPSPSGYNTARGIGSFRGADGGIHDDINPFSNRLKTHMNFPPGMSPTLGMLSRITEVENENGITNGLDEAKIGHSRGDNLFYNPGFQYGSWNGPPNFTDSFSVSIKREFDNDQQLFGDTQNMEPDNRPHMLTHHLSLPKTSAEMATMEKLLHLQDSVPCKIRAKRGCATHPRSIAERVRRTKISERMRKLQDLVPNMDKQTNTADMLDLAVDYIKNLQQEYKMLSETRSNCKCSCSQNTALNQ